MHDDPRRLLVPNAPRGRAVEYLAPTSSEEATIEIGPIATAPRSPSVPELPEVTEIVKRYGFAIVKGCLRSAADEDEATATAHHLSSAFGELWRKPAELGTLATGDIYRVQDRGFSMSEGNMMYSATNERLDLHTDGTDRASVPDYFGLLCVHPASSGGVTSVTDATRAHNHLLDGDPESLEMLYRDFFREVVRVGRAELLNHSARLEHRWPIFARDRYRRGLTFRYTRRWVLQGHKDLEVPLTDAELTALDTLETALATNAISFHLERGDWLIADNHVIAHARTGFVDGTSTKRLLLRSWITARPEHRRETMKAIGGEAP